MEKLIDLLIQTGLTESEAEELLDLLYSYLEKRRKSPAGVTSSKTCRNLT